MNWFIKKLVNYALDALEKQVLAYVKSTPEAWDDELAQQTFAFLRSFLNGTPAQQRAALATFKAANLTFDPLPPE